MSALNPVDEYLGGHLSHFLHWYMNGSQHGGEVLGCIDVIDADEGKIIGNGKPGFLNGPHDTDGGIVVAAEYGRDVGIPGEQFLGPFISAF